MHRHHRLRHHRLRHHRLRHHRLRHHRLRHHRRTTVSGTTVSSTTVSGTTVSSTTVSGTTVSGTTVSGTTVSGTTVAEALQDLTVIVVGVIAHRSHHDETGVVCLLNSQAYCRAVRVIAKAHVDNVHIIVDGPLKPHDDVGQVSAGLVIEHLDSVQLDLAGFSPFETFIQGCSQHTRHVRSMSVVIERSSFFPQVPTIICFKQIDDIDSALDQILNVPDLRIDPRIEDGHLYFLF